MLKKGSKDWVSIGMTPNICTHTVHQGKEGLERVQEPCVFARHQFAVMMRHARLRVS
jgi:hypothetical protein